jgi:hypothetical protein
MQRTIAIAAALSVLAFSAGLARAEESCESSGKVMPKSQIEAMLKKQGYTKIREIREHSGCYEAKGFDKNGKRFELEINASTGKISKAE